MMWEDERYVRLYVRDTMTWKMLPWQSKCLIPIVMRKLDRAGMLDLGADGWDGLAALTDMPLEVVEAGMPSLIKRGVFLLAGTRVVMPNFLPAQEAAQSDKARKAAQRERERLDALRTAAEGDRNEPPPDPPPSPMPPPSAPKTDTDVTGQHVTPCDNGAQNVTSGHDSHEQVTSGHKVSLRAVPSVPSVPSVLGVQGGVFALGVDEPEPKPAKRRRSKPPNVPPSDEPPEAGTPARRIFDAIVADPYVSGITTAPADFAKRVCEPDAYPGINPVAVILRALEWRAGKGAEYRDGRAFLRGWLDREAKEAAAKPKPAQTRGPAPPAPASSFPSVARDVDPLAPKARTAS